MSKANISTGTSKKGPEVVAAEDKVVNADGSSSKDDDDMLVVRKEEEEEQKDKNRSQTIKIRKTKRKHMGRMHMVLNKRNQRMINFNTVSNVKR